MNRLSIVATMTLALAPAAFASTRIDLNGDWQFKIDAGSEGEASGWAKAVPPAKELVRVPHTWGVGAHEDHAGLAWYFRTFAVPGELRAGTSRSTSARPSTGRRSG